MIGRISIGCLIWICCASACHADGVIRDSLGARTTGRGGINLGFADNGQMILENPAAIVNMPSIRLREFGFDMLITDIDFSDPDNPRTSGSNNPFPMGQMSMAFKSPSSDVGFGFGIFPQAGFSATYDVNGPVPFSGPQRYKSIGALIRFLPALSWKVNDRLSVGGNLGVAANHMELEGPYFLQGPSPFAGTPTKFDFQGTGASLSWAVSLQYLLTQQTTVGVSYQSKTRFELDGSTQVEIPGLGSSRFESLLDIEWPQSLGIGLQHQVNCCTRVGVDVTWFDWSSAFDSFDMTLVNPDNPVFAAVVGSSLNESFPLNWRDTVSVKLGVERDLMAGMVARAGYVYHRNPIPAETLSPFLQTTLEHAFSVGFGWQQNATEFDLGYQYSFSSEQNVGASQFIGGDFDNSTHNTKAHWVALSAIKRF